jgi:hypothetical protein
MDLTEALYTTRAMRRVKTDPIPYDVQARIATPGAAIWSSSRTRAAVEDLDAVAEVRQ